MRKYLISILLLTVLLASLLSVPAFAEDTAVLTADDVNLRAGPGYNYEVLGCYPAGTEVLVIDRSNAEWTAVSIDGVRGFVYAGYVRMDTDEAEITIVTTEPEATQPPATAAGESGYINAMYVRLRSAASLDATVLGEFNRGAVLTITGSSGDWTAVVINGQSGYVYSSFVSRGTPEPTTGTEPAPAETAAPADGTNAVLVKDDVYLYCDPSFYSDIKGVFNKGERLIVSEQQGDWYVVSIYGYPGYKI